MRNFPAEVIASWPAPNYEDPPTRGDALVTVLPVFIALAVFSVALRVYARICLTQWFGADDLCIVFALITAIGMTVCVLLANLSYGWNRHVWDLPLDMIAPAYQIAFATKIIFCLATMFARLSLTFFYYRLVKDSGMHAFRNAIHCTLVFHFALGFSSVIINIFQCTPIKAFWTFPVIPGSRCLDEGILTLGCGILITFADFITAALPIPMILRLKMPLRRKIGVSILLGLGFLVTVAGAIRTFFIWFSLIESYDETWYCYPLWIAAAVEVDLAVICACAPSFRLVLHDIVNRHFPRLRQSVASISSRGRSKSPPMLVSGASIMAGAEEPSRSASLWSAPFTGQKHVHPLRPTLRPAIPDTAASMHAEATAALVNPGPCQHAQTHTFIEHDASLAATASSPAIDALDRTHEFQRARETRSDIHVTTNFDVTSALWGSDDSMSAFGRFSRRDSEQNSRSQEQVRRLTSLDRSWRT